MFWISKKPVKSTSADIATMVRMKVMFRDNLLRARNDSTTPTETPVMRIAKGAANHQWNDTATAMALAAITAKILFLSHPAMWMNAISTPE